MWAVNTNLYKSSDGGVTFKHVVDPHGDNHDLWIASNDPQRLIESNDGGPNVSFNGGKTWTDQDVATAQFYHVETTNHFPYRVCGAQQDNSGVCGPSRWPVGIDRGQWYDVSGESGYIQARPDNPDITYGGDNSGFLGRVDHKTNSFRLINPWPDSPDGHAAAEGKYRFQWTAPLLISPHDPHVLYHGGNVLFKSVNEGQSWTVISPDLTRHDPKTLGPSGGPITLDQTTAEYYGTIFALAESPRVKGLIWAGSDDGLVHLTRNGGKTWTDVTPPQLGDFTRVSIIEASHYAPGTAYIAANRYQLDQDRERNPRHRVRAGRARGPGAARAALRGHGTGRLGVLRRRRELAVAPSQPADRAGARPRDQGRRSGRRDARTLVLDPRRHRAATPAGAGDPTGIGASLQAS
ncbi:MAG: hypothetical protein DMD67_11680 [Gemmatimonadetes bacterium]|nr:MAG: hypothetical protein DMD67_11680 [Gemmatimonadota bacterium]